MQNIKVSRYARPERVGYQGLIEPEDGSWILWIPNEGVPELWQQVKVKTGDGVTDHEYQPVTLTGHLD